MFIQIVPTTAFIAWRKTSVHPMIKVHWWMGFSTMTLDNINKFCHVIWAHLSQRERHQSIPIPNLRDFQYSPPSSSRRQTKRYEWTSYSIRWLVWCRCPSVPQAIEFKALKRNNSAYQRVASIDQRRSFFRFSRCHYKLENSIGHTGSIWKLAEFCHCVPKME